MEIPVGILLDFVLAAVLLKVIYNCYHRGLVAVLLKLVGTVASYIVAALLSRPLSLWAYETFLEGKVAQAVAQRLPQELSALTPETLAGLEEKLTFWHSLGPLDEDELLRRLELHIDEFPPEVKEKRGLVISLLEKRRRILRDMLLREHPGVKEHLDEKQALMERRLRKQNPAGMRRLREISGEETPQQEEENR